MKKDYYMHQRFLLDCDYESVSLPNISRLEDTFIQDFTETVNLFDTEDIITRKVNFSYLLKEIDTQEDFDAFLQKIKFVDNLIIENDMPKNDNPIIEEFQESCFKAFHKLLENLKVGNL